MIFALLLLLCSLSKLQLVPMGWFSLNSKD
jgi:hypothetical protein